ncbi:MAG: flavodoxin domain-containing protein [Candidatus Omnitrophota bacterium]
MDAVELKKGIYWVGAVDWNVRTFHGHTYSTARGTTYNSYLINDDKVTLIDGVYAPFTGELIKKIRDVAPPEKIENIIVNHIEPDHSGALPELLKLCPDAKLYGTAKCKEGLQKQYYGNWDIRVVKTGDKLNIGKRTLSFIEAPMIHWPDSMFTYCAEEEILFPNDAFGQHYASSERFDDETDRCVLMEEASKYYANILWPLGGIIARKIEEIQKTGLPIKMIAPSHGIIWRGDPMKIVNAYASWTKNETKRKAAVVYETMWGSTAKMAGAIADGLTEAGVDVKLFDIALSDRTEVANQMLDAKAFVIGSSTHDNGMLPSIASFLGLLKGFKPKGRITAAFGSYGWAGGAVAEIEGMLKEGGMEIALPSVSARFVPDASELERCRALGAELAKKIA